MMYTGSGMGCLQELECSCEPTYELDRCISALARNNSEDLTSKTWSLQEECLSSVY